MITYSISQKGSKKRNRHCLRELFQGREGVGWYMWILGG